MQLIVSYAIFAYVAVGNAAISEESVDPCLPSVFKNISHISERYARLKDGCPYTDRRIDRAWFYSGEDPIVTSPPGYCSCGYKFPIWMNGTLPSEDDGIVNRQACMKFITSCHEVIQIQVKNCGSYFVYHLRPSPDDSGFCFGIDKPNATDQDEKVPANATVLIQQSSITSNSFICSVATTDVSDTNVNITAELFVGNGTVIRSIIIDKPTKDVKWVNLSAETNYTINVFTNGNEYKKVIASAWVLTKKVYRAPKISFDIPPSSITNQSFSVRINFVSGNENKTANGRVLGATNSIVASFSVDKPSVVKKIIGLESGTKYIVEIYMYLNDEHIILGTKWIITRPDIMAHLKSKTSGKLALTSTAFACKFQPWRETVYSVRWFIHRNVRNLTLYKEVEHVKDVEDLSLTEEDLVKNHMSLPFNISCSVAEGSFVPNMNFSVSSTNLFAGIKILTPMITMHRDEIANILLSPTIPFGCINLQTTGVNGCNLTLAITVPVSKNCTGISTRQCRVSVQGIAGSSNSLQIQASEDGQYSIQKDATYKVIFRTTNMLIDSMWRDYTLPAVTVLIKPETNTYWRGKRCEALNDPHMYTFDGMRYEHHEHLSDEYVLYTHESYAAKIHHKLERCNTNAMCNCGVAVQAGRDIYLISTCNNIMEIGYKQCDDGVLLVKRENDYTYTIHLPFGTYVKARLDKTPYYNSVGSMIVSVSVYPSVHDQHGRSKGLCGTLDQKQTNDFHDRIGITGLSRTEFILAWKVSREESLFGTNTKSTLPWQHPACSCTVSNGHVAADDKCRLGADNACVKGQTVGEQTCKFAEKISLEGAKTQSVPVLNLNKHMTTKGPGETSTTAIINESSSKIQHLLFKFTPENNGITHDHWNTFEATSFCTNFMNRSRAFRLCSRVPFTDTDRAIQTCTQDILITQSTEWHKLSRQSMQDACISEINRNKTVREHYEPSKKPTSSPSPPGGHHSTLVTTPKPSDTMIDSNLNINELIDVIKDIACPNECSDNGNCNNGTCKCVHGFGGDDCSIDFKQAPSTASFLHGRVCDEKETPCTHVFIHGGLFASETVSCHITTFKTYAYKEGRQNLDAYVIRGQTQSLIEVICPLTSPIRKKRSVAELHDVKLLSCYGVAVSNDGIHHGSPIAMCVYNSRCQSLLNDSTGLLTAKIKRGFCYIDGRCVPSNERESSSETYCLPSISLYSWSEMPSSTESLSTITASASAVPITPITDNSWHTHVIIAAVCVCCLCVIVGIVFYIRQKKQRKTCDNKKEKEELELSNKHNADFDEETYAHINPIDVRDDVFNGLESQKRDVTNDYSRLDKAKKEKADYATLNATQNIRYERNGPSLPERPFTDPADPYETLQSQNQAQRDYERIRYTSGSLELNGRSNNSYGDRISLPGKRITHLILDDNQTSFPAPTDRFDQVESEDQRVQVIKEHRSDDGLEGYERPDPLYRRY